ncbi:MAG: hypothetical protein JZD41_04360, partial [Thermoproteus sp.]|nr:hypothetical protein [Thermoproteus sp.]
LSTYEVRRILSAAGAYRPTPYTCPRCFSKLRVVDRYVKSIGGTYKIVEELYCLNCGYEEKISDGLDMPNLNPPYADHR